MNDPNILFSNLREDPELGPAIEAWFQLPQIDTLAACAHGVEFQRNENWMDTGRLVLDNPWGAAKMCWLVGGRLVEEEAQFYALMELLKVINGMRELG